MSVALEDIPEVARIAWGRLRDELHRILGADLVAMWAYGGTTFPDRPRRSGDLDTHVVVGRPLDEETTHRIKEAHAVIARDLGVEWDAWYILAEDARRAESPPHAFRAERRDTSWALHRAHWLAGQYVQLDGRKPGEIVPAPTWAELDQDLRRELEHLERHVVEGDNHPSEAAYAIFNGCRILRSVETGDVVISKRSAGTWALEHLPAPWHAAVHATGRAYDGDATPEDGRRTFRGNGPICCNGQETVGILKIRCPTSPPTSLLRRQAPVTMSDQVLQKRVRLFIFDHFSSTLPRRSRRR